VPRSRGPAFICGSAKPEKESGQAGFGAAVCSAFRGNAGEVREFFPEKEIV
jgi:hypothetical protein